MRTIPGITRADEEATLSRIIDIAQTKLEQVKGFAKDLENELHSMQQEFDENDKEQQALWHTADARFQEMKQEIQRAGQARRKPYFGRIDFRDRSSAKEEAYYIGRSVIAEDPANPEVIDWRAPIAGVYYDCSPGEASYSVKGEGKYLIDLKRKRTYEIEKDQLKDFYDSDVVANDELLTKYLAKNKKAVLGEIIATIQQEQNEIIRKKPQHNMVIQGAAGSGKTTVAMHRISYILYNYELEFKPEDFYVIGSNQVLLNYITGVLPDLNVYGVCQMTMEQLFVRLLYEDWDPKRYRIKPMLRGITEPEKGRLSWFRDLEAFAKEYEWSLIPKEDVVLEKNHVRLMSGDTITSLLERFDKLSRADKISMLSERLLGKLENEICGKYYSYSGEEKKKLRRYYENYFGKREWKGSIYELYHEFLMRQTEKGILVAESEDAYDIYDLAALAYLYKRLKETEIIREAGHVVIDEAQDFGMMAYCSLKYCLSTCTYTIMGDVSQNIFWDYGLNDWQELRDLMLPGEFDTFGLLRKSYRNTVEISEFATLVLRHGSFYVYPAQPIIRHGDPVKIDKAKDDKELVALTGKAIMKWQEKGFETIAVICPDQQRAQEVEAALEKNLGERIRLLTPETGEQTFGNGVMVLPLELTKGLEFDAVLLYDCSARNYPKEDAQVKRLYVAATRALHELAVLYQGELTGLIADPLEEGQEQKVITQEEKPARKPLPLQEEKTHAELAKEQAQWGEQEISRRHYIGPRRIETGSRRGEEKQATESLGKDQQPSKERGTELLADRIQRLQESSTRVEGGEEKRKPLKVKVPAKTAKPGYRPSETTMVSYLNEQLKQGASGKRLMEREHKRESLRQQEFGSMPEQRELTVPGHSRIDNSIKMCMKDGNALQLINPYGVLRVEAVGKTLLHIRFHRGQATDFEEEKPGGIADGGEVKAQLRENREFWEVSTGKVSARIQKKSGEVSFWNASGKLLLTERAKEARFADAGRAYTFFDWSKKESLYANPPTGKLPEAIGQSAKYISYGKEISENPGIYSSLGYELLFPTDCRTLCCNIPMYGPYIRQDGEEIDYYFRVKG